MKPLNDYLSNELYKLTLGDSCCIEDGNLFTTALRVPGGWICRSIDKSHDMIGSVFVPFNNEFQMSNTKELDSKIHEVIKYCEPHQDYMWAKYIIGILTNKKDWRD